MKLAEINMYTNYSTGKIMMGIADYCRGQGVSVQTYSTAKNLSEEKIQEWKAKGHIFWGGELDHKLHGYLGKLFGLNGAFSVGATKKLLRELDAFDPDVIHLHNIHDFCLNFKLLFRYLKKSRAKIIWTFHDCWPFTGHCPYFQMVGCDKWVTGCHHCPQLSVYPKNCVDNTSSMWKKKREMFGNLDMTIVTPSRWLAELVRFSYLKEKPIKVIHNGIDLSLFEPTPSDFREKYNCREKYILLGVAADWGIRKGLDVFSELSERLDERYQIVLVGTDDHVDKQLPPNIISIHRTQNQKELAELYTAADLFVNPTREDNFPTVNLEALACGTPVVTFQTGGSPEVIDESCGVVVPVDDIDALQAEIIRICEDKPFSQENCIKRSKCFDMNERFKEYLKLYEDCTHSGEFTV